MEKEYPKKLIEYTGLDIWKKIMEYSRPTEMWLIRYKKNEHEVIPSIYLEKMIKASTEEKKLVYVEIQNQVPKYSIMIYGSIGSHRDNDKISMTESDGRKCYIFKKHIIRIEFYMFQPKTYCLTSSKDEAFIVYNQLYKEQPQLSASIERTKILYPINNN
jgi:hypothetical protein